MVLINKKGYNRIWFKNFEFGPLLVFGKNIIIVVYMDDIVFFTKYLTTTISFINKTKEIFQKITNNGKIREYFSIEIKECEDGIFLSNMKWIDTHLKDFIDIEETKEYSKSYSYSFVSFSSTMDLKK